MTDSAATTPARRGETRAGRVGTSGDPREMDVPLDRSPRTGTSKAVDYT